MGGCSFLLKKNILDIYKISIQRILPALWISAKSKREFHSKISGRSLQEKNCSPSSSIKLTMINANQSNGSSECLRLNWHLIGHKFSKSRTVLSRAEPPHSIRKTKQITPQWSKRKSRTLPYNNWSNKRKSPEKSKRKIEPIVRRAKLVTKPFPSRINTHNRD